MSLFLCQTAVRLAKRDVLLTAKRGLMGFYIEDSSCHKLLLNDKESYMTSNQMNQQ